VTDAEIAIPERHDPEKFPEDKRELYKGVSAALAAIPVYFDFDAEAEGEGSGVSRQSLDQYLDDRERYIKPAMGDLRLRESRRPLTHWAPPGLMRASCEWSERST